jgi:hypothetical protein
MIEQEEMSTLHGRQRRRAAASFSQGPSPGQARRGWVGLGDSTGQGGGGSLQGWQPVHYVQMGWSGLVWHIVTIVDQVAYHMSACRGAMGRWVAVESLVL